MTREKAALVLRFTRSELATCSQLTDQRREAFDLAIAALEGKCEGYEKAKIPKNREEWSVCTQVEADQKMDSQSALTYIWHSGGVFGPFNGPPQWESAARLYAANAIRERDELREQLNAAEEALKAMERFTAKQNLGLEELNRNWGFELQRSRNFQIELAAAVAELSQEREKIERLKNLFHKWPDGTVHNGGIWIGLDRARFRINEIFPDPEPLPEPQMWDWCLKQPPKAKIKWKMFPPGFWIECDESGFYWRYNKNGYRTEASFTHEMFTEPGWLPYEEK